MNDFQEAYPYEYFNYAVDPEEKIATVTMCNPSAPSSNVTPWWADRQLLELIDRWERDEDVKVVILRGAGDHFSAGHDFATYRGYFKLADSSSPRGHPSSGTSAKELRRASNREQLIAERDLHELIRRYIFSLKPVIAEVRGRCFDFGNHLQAFADVSIAAEDAHLGGIGHTAGDGGIDFLRLYSHLIGFKRAREMWMLGRTWSGRDAALIGLVNRAVPAGELEEYVRNEARRVALLPIDGIVTGKAYTHLVLEGMGFGQACTEMYYGHTLGLRSRIEPGEYALLRDLRRVGNSQALKNRRDRYKRLGGFGEYAERPIVP